MMSNIPKLGIEVGLGGQCDFLYNIIVKPVSIIVLLAKQ